MELSKRLQAVADLVSDGMTVADVGTDHGYIPIYLVKNQKSPRAIAMDVNQGPLMRAKEHIEAFNLLQYIDARLSDGVAALREQECECVVIAGMGGALTIKIMTEGETLFKSLKEFVLQPQSEIAKVRQFLCENRYRIVKEDMVFEDGKYYPMMKVINDVTEAYNATECLFGKCMLEQKHPVLQQFLQKEAHKKETIIRSLEKEAGAHIDVRKQELKNELEGIRDALQRYYSCD